MRVSSISAFVGAGTSQLNAAIRVLCAALLFASIILVACLLSRYWWIFGGDPEIHIIFAKNFLQGHVLEFNAGYRSGGETSPLYMLIVAGGCALLGQYVPFGMKALGYLSLAGIGYFLYISNRTAPVWRRRLVVLLAACMPFFIFQASLGMENMLFAAAVAAAVHTQYNTTDRRLVLSLPATLPLLFFLRPEAIFIGIWLGCIAVVEKKLKHLLVVIGSFALTYLLYEALNRYTGVETHNAGLMRAYLSTLGAVRLVFLGHELFLSPRVVVGMCYAAPFLAYAGLKYRALSTYDRITLCTLVLFPAVLHLFNVLPTTHFSRYFLFEYAVLLYVFSFRFLATSDTNVLVAIWAVTLLLAVAEIVSRGSVAYYSVFDSIRERSSEAVKAYSDTLVASLHSPVVPISIATQEVQLRGRLDERFVVWSLDGITDYRLATHLQDGYVDHLGYLRDRRIGFVMGLENYNRDRSKPSLLDLQPIPGHSRVCRDGLQLDPTAVNNTFRVSECAAN